MCVLSVLMGFLQDGSHVWLPLMVSFFIAGHRHLQRSVFLLYAVWIHDRRTLRVHWTANVTAATTTAKPFLLSVFLSGAFDTVHSTELLSRWNRQRWRLASWLWGDSQRLWPVPLLSLGRHTALLSVAHGSMAERSSGSVLLVAAMSSHQWSFYLL